MFLLEQVLAAFLKAIGFIIPLMDAMYANYYTRELMVILVREFQTPDEEMKKIVLKVNPTSPVPVLSAANHAAVGGGRIRQWVLSFDVMCSWKLLQIATSYV